MAQACRVGHGTEDTSPAPTLSTRQRRPVVRSMEACGALKVTTATIKPKPSPIPDKTDSHPTLTAWQKRLTHFQIETLVTSVSAVPYMNVQYSTQNHELFIPKQQKPSNPLSRDISVNRIRLWNDPDVVTVTQGPQKDEYDKGSVEKAD